MWWWVVSGDRVFKSKDFQKNQKKIFLKISKFIKNQKTGHQLTTHHLTDPTDTHGQTNQT